MSLRTPSRPVHGARTARRAVALAGAVLAVGALAACSGGDRGLGDTATVSFPSADGDLPFEVAVTAIDEAPAEVQEAVEGDDTVWFTTLTLRYTGDTGMANIPNPGETAVYAQLDDGSLMDVTFMGVDECAGATDGSTGVEAAEVIAAGEQVEWCVPLSGDGDNELAGVFVGPDPRNGEGTVWTRS
jgi:hypothetical protein